MNTPEGRFMFEVFDARPRTKKLKSLMRALYVIAERGPLRQPFDWLGDRVDDFCRWDLNRQHLRKDSSGRTPFQPDWLSQEWERLCLRALLRRPRFERQVDGWTVDDDGTVTILPATVHWLIDGVEVTEHEFRSHPQSPLPI